MEVLGKYKNGNYMTTILSDGTRIKETEEDAFIPAFAENIDIKICDCCDMACKFCHEGSTAGGRLGNIMGEKFVETLHPYQEVALGGGNVLEHPDFIPFLKKLRDKKVLTNITLNQYHFEQEMEMVDWLISERLIYGLGISLVSPNESFISTVKRYPNAVIHVINGLLRLSDVEILANQGLKILILGYKYLRRGEEWYREDYENIVARQKCLQENLSDMMSKFEVLSFDNLAIEQLGIRELLSKKEWDQFYAGDDGTYTYYIDMVERKFAINSIAPPDKRYDLLDSVDDMFRKIRV